MMPKTQVQVEYDSEYDILYLIVGEPTASDAEWIEEDVYIRKDMNTRRIAGIIIEDYSKKNMEHLSKILPMGLGKYLPVFN
jgi:uncharacterized protein YuzE